MTFEKVLKEYRKQLGLSQEKMAEKINVSRQAITKWESGAGMPDITNLKAISDLFQVSIDDLLLEKKSRYLRKIFYMKVIQNTILKVKNILTLDWELRITLF